MKKVTKKIKKVTIDDLAVLMKTGFGGVNNKIDNAVDLIDKLAASTLKGFNSIDKRFDTVDKRFDTVDKRFDTVEKDIKDVRSDIFNLGDRFVSYHTFDQLASRVNILEKKHK